MKQLRRKSTNCTKRRSLIKMLIQFRYKRKRIREFRKWTAEDQRRLIFYRQFISPNDLVFDVGANVGNRTKVFAKMGAKVIAIEPQSKCADILNSATAGTDNIQLVQAAIGSSSGYSTISISDVDTLSSLSADWIQSVKQSGRFSKFEWTMEESVVVHTIDELIAKYGLPKFIKIDVEGYEDHVISGLTQPVEAISIEYTPEFIEGTMRCIENLENIGSWKYQFSLEESLEFSLANWVGASELRKILMQVNPAAFGDVYAKNIVNGDSPSNSVPSAKNY